MRNYIRKYQLLHQSHTNISIQIQKFDNHISMKIFVIQIQILSWNCLFIIAFNSAKGWVNQSLPNLPKNGPWPAKIQLDWWKPLNFITSPKSGNISSGNQNIQKNSVTRKIPFSPVKYYIFWFYITKYLVKVVEFLWWLNTNNSALVTI